MFKKTKSKIFQIFLSSTLLISGFLFFQTSAQAASQVEINADELIQLTNQTREEYGLQTLTKNDKLTQAAEEKAKDMIDKDYFAHESPEGITPWYWIEKEDYDYMYAGENLALGFLTSETAHQAWLDSPTHKDNIINCHYQEIGMAVIVGEFKGSNTTIAVQMFGSQDNKYENCENPTAPKNTDISNTEEANTPPVPALNSLPIETPSFLTPDQNLITNQTSLRFKIKSQPNTDIILYQNEKAIHQAKTNQAGEVEWKVSQFSDGEYFFQIQARDQAGNLSDLSQALKIIIDTIPPQIDKDLSFVTLDPKDPLNKFLIKIKTEDTDAIKAIAMSSDQIYELEKTETGFQAVILQTNDTLLASVQDSAGNVIDFKLNFLKSAAIEKKSISFWQETASELNHVYKINAVLAVIIFSLTIFGYLIVNLTVKHPKEAILG